MKDFAVRYEGKGLALTGEKLDRLVFHCRKRQPLVILVRGEGNSGKTVLCNELVAGNQVQYIKTDGMIAWIGSGKKISSVVEDYIAEKYVQYSSSIRRVVDDLDKDEAMSIDFAEMVHQKISLDERLIIIEGYALTNKVVEYLLRRLKGVAFVWEVNRARILANRSIFLTNYSYRAILNNMDQVIASSQVNLKPLPDNIFTFIDTFSSIIKEKQDLSIQLKKQTQIIKRQERTVKRQEQKIDNLETSLQTILNSNSWKITSPLRKIGQLFNKPTQEKDN